MNDKETMNEKSEQLKTFMQNYGAHLAFAVALTAMLGSLYFSEIARFIPCTLCWYQRILMYPLTVIILVGIIERDEFLPKYVLPLSIIGIILLGLSAWTIVGALRQHPTPGSARWSSPAALRA